MDKTWIGSGDRGPHALAEIASVTGGDEKYGQPRSDDICRDRTKRHTLIDYRWLIAFVIADHAAH